MRVEEAPAWGSTTSILELAMWLRDCRRVIVLTHQKPDGDAAGSTLALVRALNLSNPFGGGPRAEAWYAGPFPPWLADVVGETPVRMLEEKATPPEHADAEAVLIVDTGSWVQLDPLGDWVKKRREVAAIVDHHVQGDADVADLRVVDTTAAAVCQPVAELCRQILGVSSLAKLPPAVATALYLGLATDTGWFRHSNVNKAVMTTAGELIDAGAEHVRLYQLVEQRESPGRLRLLARALSSLELAPLGRTGRHVALMSLSKRDFAESGAEPGESGGFVDFGQAIPSVMVTALLTDVGSEASSANGAAGRSAATAGAGDGKRLTKISMRSKPESAPGAWAVDVNVAAKELGGGGHVRAAGARLNVSLDEAREAVLAAIRKQMPAT